MRPALRARGKCGEWLPTQTGEQSSLAQRAPLSQHGAAGAARCRVRLRDRFQDLRGERGAEPDRIRPAHRSVGGGPPEVKRSNLLTWKCMCGTLCLSITRARVGSTRVAPRPSMIVFGRRKPCGKVSLSRFTACVARVCVWIWRSTPTRVRIPGGFP